MRCRGHICVTDSRGHQRGAIRTHSTSTIRLSAGTASRGPPAHTGSLERDFAGGPREPIAAGSLAIAGIASVTETKQS